MGQRLVKRRLNRTRRGASKPRRVRTRSRMRHK